MQPDHPPLLWRATQVQILDSSKSVDDPLDPIRGHDVNLEDPHFHGKQMPTDIRFPVILAKKRSLRILTLTITMECWYTPIWSVSKLSQSSATYHSSKCSQPLSMLQGAQGSSSYANNGSSNFFAIQIFRFWLRCIATQYSNMILCFYCVLFINILQVLLPSLCSIFLHTRLCTEITLGWIVLFITFGLE